MLPMVYPNSTKDLQSHSDLEKRYLWWVLAAVWKTAETGIAIKGLVDDCQDWSNDEADNWGKFSCVYGAISTVITVAGAGWGGYEHGSGIWNSLKSYLWRRETTGVTSEVFLSHLVSYQLATVNHTQLPWTPVTDSDGVLLLDGSRTGAPILFGYDFNGIPAHMSYDYIGGENMSVSFNFRHQAITRPGLIKREQFNEQDFSTGGLEAGFSYNQQYDGGWLDPANDYGQMDHEVSCELGDLSNNGLQFQIYDNNHHGTIAAGNIRACSEHSYDSGSLFQLDLPTPQNGRCEVS